jgi:UDPglucose 6-dehydrogenase
MKNLIMWGDFKLKIAVIGTGYVGLVTGVSLSEIGHSVTCIDINAEKIEKMKEGISPIYEPGLDELMVKNIKEGRLGFTTDYKEGFDQAKVIYLAVGTPQSSDGSANLSYILSAAIAVANNISQDVIVVTKSTVPVGTNDLIKERIKQELHHPYKVHVVSNPEFLREGSAIYDTFNGDRIVIGADNSKAAKVLEEVNKPFGVPIYKTDIRSAEMIKYASNTFLATKISFINEIANICERLGANVDEVAIGMGMDYRIGNQFLQAGIGYGGSCFPKDTHALVNIGNEVGFEFQIVKSAIEVNEQQQLRLIEKLSASLGDLKGKKIALLGLSFKPNTDDMRESPAIPIAKYLIERGAQTVAYDPAAVDNAKKELPNLVEYKETIEECLEYADAALIITGWDEIANVKTLEIASKRMKEPIIFDGRNCFDLDLVKKYHVNYHSIGRPVVNQEMVLA